MRVPLVFLPLVAAACGSGATSAVPSELLGTWTFGADPSNLISLSTVPLRCDGSDPKLNAFIKGSLAGVAVRVTRSKAGLDLEVGCRCHVQMKVSGHHATALTNPQQTCELVTNSYQVSCTISDWEIDLDPAGPTLTLTACGNANAIRYEPRLGMITPIPTGFTIGGTLAPVPDRVSHCGDDDSAVGVVPYFAGGLGECPIGAGFEGVEIFMFDEEEPTCASSSGVAGEPAWVYPDAAKEPPPSCPTNVQFTPLLFCRVDSRLFSAATSGGPAYDYAVLNLSGKGTCPNGSEPVMRHISNEDTDDRSFYAGHPDPNRVVVDPTLGEFTELHFCVFRAASSASGGDAGAAAGADPFPDLGFPYAVFHDFDGFQPPWVIRKSWLLSADEVPRNDDYYCHDPGPATESLAAMVEGDRVLVTNTCQAPIRTVDHATTVFDLARVR